MDNKQYAEAMRQEADKWMQLLPVTKELWLQIADRIEASPDPLLVQQERRIREQIERAKPENHWIYSLFRKQSRKKVVELKPFVWMDPK